MSKRETCGNGHTRTEDNTRIYTPPGRGPRRVCRDCDNERHRKVPGTLLPPGPEPIPALDRFAEKIDRRDPDGCWPWIGYSGKTGAAPRLWDGERMRPARRVWWEAERGPLADDTWVVATCDHPACMNPAHLELATMADRARHAATSKKVPPNRALLSRLMDRVEVRGPRGCWPWRGKLTQAGGAVWVSVRSQPMHPRQAMWQLSRGRALPENATLVPTCRSILCTNPDHMRMVTASKTTGRKPPVVNRRRKLTDADVLEMRRLHVESGATMMALADKYGVGHTVVSRILRGLSWMHVTEGVSVFRNQHTVAAQYRAVVAARLSEGVRTTDIAAELGVSVQRVSMYKRTIERRAAA